MQEFVHKDFIFYNLVIDRHFWIALFVIFFIAPVVKFKKMDALRFCSVIAILGFAYVTVIIVLYAIIPNWSITKNNPTGIVRGKVSPFPTNIIDFLKVIPIYIFAFTCH